ncbi:MAG: hypothetical protein K6F74_11335 [Prevotella sp.]|nr:hypothetical protein [Prevotella sp.]
MKKSRVIVYSLGAIALLLLTVGCLNGQKQPRAYVSDLTSGDSVSIKMGQYSLLKYHSDRLGFDINYPSFLVHQDLPEDVGMQEIFMMDDVSLSVMVDSLNGMMRSPGQQMMGMGADLVEVGDDYSIHEGQDDKWEYYGKVIESDSLRMVTVMLRYYPEHVDAVEMLKEWVKSFKVE